MSLALRFLRVSFLGLFVRRKDGLRVDSGVIGVTIHVVRGDDDAMDWAREMAGELETDVAGVEGDEKSLAIDERHDLQEAAVGVENAERDDEADDGESVVETDTELDGRDFLPLNNGLGSSSVWIGDATGSGGSGFVARYRLGFLRGIGGVRQRVNA